MLRYGGNRFSILAALALPLSLTGQRAPPSTSEGAYDSETVTSLRLINISPYGKPRETERVCPTLKFQAKRRNFVVGGQTLSAGSGAEAEKNYRFRSKLLRLTRLSMRARRSSIFTRSWLMVSRSRTVTQPSSSDWWSTVMQNGVPMASCLR